MPLQHHLSSQTPRAKEVTTITTATSARSVPLHTLCEKCRLFCQTWEVLDWAQNDGKKQSPKGLNYYVCAVAHCLQLRGTCHLCTWLSAALERHQLADEMIKNKADLNIFFYGTSRDGIICAVSVLVIVEDGIDLEPLNRDQILGTFPLKKYDRE